MYRTIIKRDGNNPLTGCAQYRVEACFKSIILFKSVLINKNYDEFKPMTVMELTTNKRYQPNCFISPRKALGI